MNKFITLILAIATLALGALYATQFQAVRALADQARAADARAEAAAAALKLAQEKLAELESRIAGYQAEADSLRKKNASAPGTSAADGKTAAAKPGAAISKEETGTGFDFGKMMKDPQMKKMIQAQASMALKMQYGDIAKELGLAPADADKVMDLLAARQSAMMEAGMGAFSEEGLDAAKIEEIGKAANDKRSDWDEQIKAIIGQDGLTKLNDYEKTLGDRMALQQYDQMLTAGGTPLEPAQRARLLDIMKTERGKLPPSPFDNQANPDVAGSLKAMRDDNAVATWVSDQEAYNQRVLDNSRTLLSPDQYTAFEKAQKQQFEMMKFGIEMGKKMMSGKNDGGAPPAPVVIPAK